MLSYCYYFSIFKCWWNSASLLNFNIIKIAQSQRHLRSIYEKLIWFQGYFAEPII